MAIPHYHSFTDLPRSLPLFPLTGVVLLPRGALPLNIFEPRYLEMVDAALAGDRLIGIIQPTESEETVLKPKLSQVGCAGRIVAYRETDDNRYLLTLSGVCRFRLDGEVSARPPIARWHAISPPLPAILQASRTMIFLASAWSRR